MDLDLAGPPPEGTSAPVGLLRALDSFGLGSVPLRPVWRNGAGGLTFAVARDGPRHPECFYVKWNLHGSGESLAQEVERLRWIEGRHPAPSVIAFASDGDAETMLTRSLPGSSAVAEEWKQDTGKALRALGAGLRQLHEVPVADCPFDWGVQHRMWSAGITAEAIPEVPPVDKLVVCQGDPCAPNTLLAADGSFLAHVDLARLGRGDRWADLAVMSMSLEWNYPNCDERIFWEAYGIEPDVARVAFYRQLWNAE